MKIHLGLPTHTAIMVVASFIVMPEARADFPIKIQTGVYHNAATGGAAYLTFRIIAEPLSGDIRECPVYDVWATNFPQLAINDIKSLSWKIDVGGQKHRFVLWPLRIEQVKKEGDALFNLRAWDDLNVEMRSQLCKAIKQTGDFAAVNSKYTAFSPYFDKFPSNWDVNGRTPAAFKHAFLQEMIEAAAKIRKKSTWRDKSPADIALSQEIEGKWRMDLVTDNEGLDDQDSLTRLTEAALLWWSFGTERDAVQTKEWQMGKYISDESFHDAERAKKFRKEFGRVWECLTDSDVRGALDAKVNTAYKGVPLLRQQQLDLWNTWKDKGLEAENGKDALTLGQIEYILNGLRFVFSKQTS